LGNGLDSDGSSACDEFVNFFVGFGFFLFLRGKFGDIADKIEVVDNGIFVPDYWFVL
jgi:hypothetical protein